METEDSKNEEARETWLKCQSYNYKEQQATSTWQPCTTKETEKRQSNTLTSKDKVAVDVLKSDKYVICVVGLCLYFLRTTREFCLICDNEKNDYRIEITQANIYERKLTVTENIYTAIETTLTKMSAIYHHTEVIPKTFLVTTECSSWNHEYIFNREPFHRFATTMNTIQAFLGKKLWNPFHFHKNSTSAQQRFTLTHIFLLEHHWLLTMTRKK